MMSVHGRHHKIIACNSSTTHPVVQTDTHVTCVRTFDNIDKLLSYLTAPSLLKGTLHILV